jgi:hypothetical protein
MAKMGRPPTGKPGQVISFNCKFDNVDWCKQLKNQGKFSRMMNHVIELEREYGAGLPDEQ